MANFSQNQIDQVWNKASIITGENPNVWRQDTCGAWINKESYGTEDKFGWEIDHKHPVAKGGSDNLSNLQPLHWKNNRNKGDSTSGNYCCVWSEGNTNKSRCGF